MDNRIWCRYCGAKAVVVFCWNTALCGDCFCVRSTLCRRPIKRSIYDLDTVRKYRHIVTRGRKPKKEEASDGINIGNCG